MRKENEVPKYINIIKVNGEYVFAENFDKNGEGFNMYSIVGIYSSGFNIFHYKKRNRFGQKRNLKLKEAEKMTGLDLSVENFKVYRDDKYFMMHFGQQNVSNSIDRESLIQSRISKIS